MARLSDNLSTGVVTKVDLAVAGFWVLLGVLGIVIGAAIGVPLIGYLGPVAALGWGIYYSVQLLRRPARPSPGKPTR
jgi:hypothetical protein